MKKVRLLFLLTAALLTFVLTGCDENVKSTYRIEVSDMSTSSQANLMLQIAVNEYVAEYNESAKTELRTEKDARSWFESACNDIKNKVDALHLPMQDDSWVSLGLSDYTNVIEPRQIYFSVS